MDDVLRDVADWLAIAAAREGSPAALLSALCRRLTAIGLPLDRAALHLRTLHPLLAGTTYEWSAAAGQATERVLFHSAASFAPMLDAAPGAIDDAGLVRIIVAGEAWARAAGLLATEIVLSDGSRQAATWLAADGLDDRRIAMLSDVATRLAAPLEIIVGRQSATTLLATYLGRRSGARVLSGEIRRGSGETINAVIWVSDLRGFTQLSERLPRDTLIGLLNAHFERLAAPIKAFGGEVLKFIGDGLLAIFPIEELGQERACTGALNAVRAARAAMAMLAAEHAAAGLPVLDFGVALHVGDVMYGNVGAPDRLDFTVIGPAVNFASRLEAKCKRLGTQVLASADFAAAVPQPLTLVCEVNLTGIASPAAVYTLPELAAR